MNEFATLWHLAQCGVTGSTITKIGEATGMNYNTTAGVLSTLQVQKMVVSTKLDTPGNPLVYVLSRIAYRLMTGHLTPKHRDAKQPPLSESFIHATP